MRGLQCGYRICILLLLRSPCKILKSYDNPFWVKSKEGKNKKKEKNPTQLIREEAVLEVCDLACSLQLSKQDSNAVPALQASH